MEGNKNNSKNNCNDSKNNSTGRKSNKTDNKIKIKNMKYRNISNKQIFNTEQKLESHKKKVEREKLIKDIKLLMNRDIKNNSTANDNDEGKDKVNIEKLDESENEVNDTVRCETLKNACQDIEIDLNKNKSISNKFLNGNQIKGRCLVEKNKNKIRLTISNIPLIEQKLKFKQKKTKTNRNSPNSFYHSSTQNNKLEISNINSANKGIFGNLDHYSFEQNYNLKSEKMKNITDKINNENNIKKENIGNNKINNEICNNNNEHNNSNKYETIFNDKYNLVHKVKFDNNNNLIKESFLYKNLEIHQHLVIFNNNENNEKENEDEDDDIPGCIII